MVAYAVQNAVPFALWIDSPNFATMPLPIFTIVLAAAGLAIPLVSAASAQVMPIAWTVQVAPGTVHQGKQFTAVVRAQIPYSWHLYSTTQPSGGPMATTFVVNSPAFTRRGRVAAREPDRAFDAIAGIKTETYSNSVTFRVPVVASQSGTQTLQLTVQYQSCTDRFCAPQKNILLKTVVSVAAVLPGKL